MRRKRIVMLLCGMLILLYGGCGVENEKPEFSISAVQLKPVESQQTQDTPAEEKTDEAGMSVEEKTTQADVATGSTAGKESITKKEEKSETESIQDEIAKVEAMSREYENADWGSMGQQDMNRTTAQWYQLWDDELNSLWSRLSNELDAETKAKVLEEQRAWIKRKEKNIRGAGMQAYGGSLQPQLENSVAEEMTRARAYILAGYLAETRNETFVIPTEIQESIEATDPDLDDVFEKFEGQWIFDKERGACVGIERTENCSYGVDGSNWVVWMTGGDIISDLDVYGYTDRNILFKVPHDGYDSYYELSFGVDNLLYFTYGTSLDEMDDIIICE